MNRGMSDGGASEGGPTDIELIDPTITPGAPTPAPDRPATVARRPGVALATLLLVGGGLAALASTGPGTVPPPTTAPTTTPTTAPAPTEPPSFDRGPTAFVGEGTELVWERVEVDPSAGNFDWTDDRFVARSGPTVMIDPATRTVTELGFEDGPTLADSSELVLVADGDGGGKQLVFPSAQGGASVTIQPSALPESDLVSLRVTYAAEQRGQDVLVLEETAAVLDVDRFLERADLAPAVVLGVGVSPSTIGVVFPRNRGDFPIDSLGFTDDDLDALRLITEPSRRVLVGPLGGTATPVETGLDRTDWVAVIGDDLLAGGSGLVRSIDGVTWVPGGDGTPRFGGLNPPGPDGVLTGLTFDGDAGFLAVSTDAGRTWQRTARVIDDSWQVISVAPVVVMSGWPGSSARTPNAPDRILTPTHTLRIDQGEQIFELFDRSGALLASGAIDDPASGFQFTPGAEAIDIIDPASGDELASIDLTGFARSVAAARAASGEPIFLSVADVGDRDGDTQEWRLDLLPDLFGSTALAVDLTPGDGWVLADVITTTGRAVFVAEIPT